MTLDPYWDKPEYSTETMSRLKSERDRLAMTIKLKESVVQNVWAEEEALRLQLQLLRTKRTQLNEEKELIKRDFDKLGTMEIDFLENMRKAQALADLENKISELENKLRELSEGRHFWDQMMPYQKEDLLYAINAFDMGLSGILNANDMGLGKTFEAITFDFLATRMFAASNNGHSPTRIWVTKKSLIKSTCREILKWFPDSKIMPLVGTTADQRNMLVDFAKAQNMMLICNYESLVTTPSIQAQHWDFIYSDEVHRLKGGANYKPTKLWEAMRDLVFNSRITGKSFFYPLSGSPIQNTPKDMWAYLHLFDPVRFDTVRHFENDYCSWIGTGIQINPEYLIKAMKSQIIRRTMSEVRDQLKSVLKDPIQDIREVDLSGEQAVIYQQMRDDFFIWLDSEKQEYLTATVIIARLNRLRQIALNPSDIVNKPVNSVKIDECMDIIDELVNNNEQVVVFSSQYNGPIVEVDRRCKEYLDIPSAVIKGDTIDIDTTCENFRQGKIKVLCINAKSGGEGLNLQKSADWPGGSSHVIMLDLWWNPKANEQAIARIYRTGQTDIVTVHTIKAAGTVDAYIDSILEDKTMMIDSIMEVKEMRKGKRDWKTALEGLV